MSGPLAGKVGLVTGASQGIGKAVALALAKDGASVVVNYNSNKAKADEVVSQIGADRATAVGADVSDLKASKAMLEETVKRFGKIDILVLNAAQLQQNGSLADTTEADFDRLYGANVKAPFFTVQQAAQYIPDGGRVIFFSTSLTTLSSVPPNYLLYLSTKGAIEQMTRVIAKDLGRRGITVNCVSPGPTATQGFMAGKTEQLVQTISSWSPQSRIAQPEEIANVVKMIASPDAQWLSGDIIRINGAMVVGV